MIRWRGYERLYTGHEERLASIKVPLVQSFKFTLRTAPHQKVAPSGQVGHLHSGQLQRE